MGKIVDDEQDFLEEQAAVQICRNVLDSALQAYGVSGTVNLLMEAILDRAQYIREYRPPVPDSERIAQEYEAIAAGLMVAQDLIKDPKESACELDDNAFDD